MKKSLIVLLIGLLIVLVLFSPALIIECLEDKKEPIEIVLNNTKTINIKILTEDKERLEFDILYEGEMYPGLLKGYIYMTVRQMVHYKNVLEILKHNSLEHLNDSLEYYIVPADSTFRVFSINAKFHLSPEVREIWDEYINAKTAKEEKDRNLKILYGE